MSAHVLSDIGRSPQPLWTVWRSSGGFPESSVDNLSEPVSKAVRRRVFRSSDWTPHPRLISSESRRSGAEGRRNVLRHGSTLEMIVAGPFPRWHQRNAVPKRLSGRHERAKRGLTEKPPERRSGGWEFRGRGLLLHVATRLQDDPLICDVENVCGSIGVHIAHRLLHGLGDLLSLGRRC